MPEPQLEFLAELGHGSMGDVLLARELPAERLVAVKRLGEVARLGAVQRARLQREARALSRLHHRNVVNLLNIVQWDGELMLVLEYVDGLSLRQLRHAGPLSIADALCVADQVHRGLAHAHGVGVIHRDVKPSNVLISRQGDCKLSDFGLARLDDLALASRTVLTRPGHPLGTAPYMAPEAALGSTKITQRADLYSFAVVVYELLVGRLPFDPDLGTLALLNSHVAATPPAPSAVVPGFPPGVEAVILAALSKDPGARPSGVAEFWYELDSAASLRWPGWRDQADLAAAVNEASPPAEASAGSVTIPGVSDAGADNQEDLSYLGPRLLAAQLRRIPPTFPDLTPANRVERGLRWMIGGLVVILAILLGLHAIH